MYKNQLQELAQRSCFCLPSYTCIREGPDHAPRFKATVNFNGEVFESPSFFTTLRQAEHAAAEVALNALSSRGPSHSLAARILDETGVYKNLLQEVAQRVGAPLPSYTTVRCGHGHQSSFTCTVELAEILFTGELAKSKKQAEKNAAMAAWNSLKQLARQEACSLSEPENNDELEQITVARALLGYRLKEKLEMANNPTASPFPRKFLIQLDKKLSSLQTSPARSKILPMIRPRSAPRARPTSPRTFDELHLQPHPPTFENQTTRPHKFNASGAAPYVPLQHFRMPYGSMVPPVTIRTAVPVFSAPPLPPPPVHQHLPHVMNPPWRMAPPVCIRPAIPVFAAPPTLFPTQPHVNQMQVKEQPAVARTPSVQLKEESPAVSPFSSLQLKEQTHSVVRYTADHVKVVPAQGSTVKVKEEDANDIVASAVKAKIERAQITAVQAKEDPAHANMAQLKEQTLTATAVDAPERPAAHSETICAHAAKYDDQEFEVQETLRALEL